MLKSGYGIEELQLETAPRLERALALYSIVAWRLLWLTYAVREQSTRDLPYTCALEMQEWQALYVATHERTQLPTQISALWEVVT